MPRYCVVYGCRNKQGTEHGGISLHSIPRDEIRARQWYERLGIEHTVKSASVCNVHFQPDDFYDIGPPIFGRHVAKRRLKINAVPSLGLENILTDSFKREREKQIHQEQVTEESYYNDESYSTNKTAANIPDMDVFESEKGATDDFWKPDDEETDSDDENLESLRIKNEIKVEQQDHEKSAGLLVCRSCLLTDCKLLDIKDNLATVYAKLTDTSLHGDLPMGLCEQCMAVLKSCCEFREKTRSAGRLLDGLLKDGELNIDKIKQIDRQRLILTPKDNNHNEDKQTDIVKSETDDQTDEFKLEVVASTDYKNYFNENTENDSYGSDYSVPSSEDEKVYKKKVKKEPKKVKRKKKGTSKKVETKTTLLSSKKRKEANDLLLKQHFVVTDFKTVEEQKQEFEKRKSSTNFIKSRFKCERCYRGFADEKAYDAHKLRYDPSRGPYACPVCHSRLPLRRLLANHSLQHERRYECMQCEFTTWAKNTALKHLHWHKGITFKCKEPECGKEFTVLTTYMSHRRLAHASDYVCGYCGYFYVSQKGLLMHMKRKHRRGKDDQIPEDGPSCEECNIRFTSEQALQKHLRVSFRHGRLERNDHQTENHKTNQKRRNWTKYAQEANEAQGFGYEYAERSTTCETCGLKFSTAAAYSRHMGSAHPEQYRAIARGCLCDVCGKVFSCPSTLADHLLTHKDASTFKCEVCGKCFKRQMNLRQHKTVHSGNRYPCDQCGKVFTQSGNRRKHMMTAHNNAKKVKCEYCDKMFSGGDSIKQHIEHVHLKKPWPKRNGSRNADRQDMAEWPRKRTKEMAGLL